ncbi:hypothetical protein HC956_08135 [Alcaligenes faecalis]|uniref:Heavy metal-binding domain-containing protein n=1 Tax=Alcaligenes ammonioxydans TaxID=2582914 RepID=A0ABX8SV37_9BURK|nr:hypothetical protein [Alcaligenes ammonioxydans]QXX78987.1 hypothetical protein FE795_08135 [Alcaligenes ammonioxydans]
MKKTLVVALLISLTGCATWSTSTVDGATTHPHQAVVPQTNASEILITESDIENRKYERLGDLTVTVNKTTVFHADPTKEMVNDKLKAEAAKLGANAVIHVTYGNTGVSFFSWGSLEGKGRAIRFIE